MTDTQTRDLTRLLARALQALGDAGQPAVASTLAAAGWAASRNACPAVDPTRELTGLLARALRALGDAGRPTHAGTLAAAGWETLRHERPVDAERLTGLLHYLARLPGDGEETTTAAEGPHMRRVRIGRTETE